MVEVIADLAGSGAMITQRPGQDLTPEMATPSSEWSAPQCKAVSPRAWLVLAEDATGLAGLNFEMAVNHLQMAADLCSQSPSNQPVGRPLRHNLRAAAAKGLERPISGPNQLPCDRAQRLAKKTAGQSGRPHRGPEGGGCEIDLVIGVKGRPGVIAQTWPCGGSDEARRETGTGGSSPPSASHGQPLTP